jgi:hypothetical protein
MDVISNHSQGSDGQPPEAQFDHRIRWGNVALALAALAAIVAAIGLPRGNAAAPTEQTLVPVTELVTESVPTLATSEVAKPRRQKKPKKRAQRKPRKQKRTHRSPEPRPQPVAPAQTPDPAPAPPAPNQPPAAEREFGL